MKNRRRRYLIDRKFQLKFIFASFFGIGVPITLLFTFLFVIYTNITVSTLDFFLDTSRIVQSIFAVKALFIVLLSLSIFFIISIYFILLYLSHRISGPIYRFIKVFKAVNAGDLKSRINLRAGDNDTMKRAQIEFNRILEEFTYLHGVRGKINELIQDKQTLSEKDMERLTNLVNKN